MSKNKNQEHHSQEHHKQEHENQQHKVKEQNSCDKEISEIKAKAQEYLGMAQRLQADFDNYRKKVEEQIITARLDGKIDAINTIIPSLDSFKQAKKVISDEKILEGVELIEKDILTAIEQIGVEKIECIGQKFDPNLHNALAVQHNSKFDDDIIIDEYQSGYRIGDKIIRYSQVIVNKRED